MAYEDELRAEIDALPSKIPQPQFVKDERFKHREYTMGEIQLLSALAGMPHYQVLLKLMEGMCEIAETEHFRQFNDKEKFDRSGMIAVAQRVFFERVQKEVEYQKQELASLQEEAQVSDQLANTPAEELIRRDIVGE